MGHEGKLLVGQHAVADEIVKSMVAAGRPIVLRTTVLVSADYWVRPAARTAGLRVRRPVRFASWLTSRGLGSTTPICRAGHPWYPAQISCSA
jgi:hypothetical protein